VNISFRLLLAFVVIAGSLVCPLLAAADSPRGPRNIVLMIGDDHGRDAGCYGHPVIKTPGMDRLAREGTRFTNAFAAVSSCSPSRSTLYTGTYNHANGMYGLAHAVHNFHSFPKMESVATALVRAGYRTAVLGKLHVGPEKVYPFEQLPCPGGPRNVIRMAEEAGKFMADVGEKPFMLVVGFTDSHRDGKGFAHHTTYPGVNEVRYDPARVVVPPFLPDTPAVRAELAEYCQSVSRLDQGVGAVLDAIAKAGRKNDTLVIYLSDNGMPFPGAKTTLYDPGIHLPLLVSCPTQSVRGGVCNAMVSWVDVAPTILDWAGVEQPESMAGRSFLGILDQENPAGWDRVFASHTFHEVTMYYPVRMVRTRRYKYLLNLAHQLEFPIAADLYNSRTWQNVLDRGQTRLGCRTVEAFLRRPREELYDLQADPDETRNLAGDPAHAETLAELRRQLRDWQQRTNDPWLIKYEHE